MKKSSGSLAGMTMLHEQGISISSTALLGETATTSWGTAAGSAQEESTALTEPDPAQPSAETQAHGG